MSHPINGSHRACSVLAPVAMHKNRLIGGITDNLQKAANFGIRPRYLDETNIGGASFEVLVEHATAAVEHGDAEVVLITYGSVHRVCLRRSRLRATSPAPIVASSTAGTPMYQVTQCRLSSEYCRSGSDGRPWEVRRHGWPTLWQMIYAGKTLVVFSSNGVKWNYNSAGGVDVQRDYLGGLNTPYSSEIANTSNDWLPYQWATSGARGGMVENVYGTDSLLPSKNGNHRSES